MQLIGDKKDGFPLQMYLIGLRIAKEFIDKKRNT